MNDKIKPISKIRRVRKVKIKMNKRRTLKGMYFNEMLSTIYKKNNLDNKEKEGKNKLEEYDDFEKHFIDKLC